MTGLHTAIAAGNREAVEALLAENRKRASERDENGVSAVMYALYVREPEIARLLATAKGRLDAFEAAALGEAELLAAVLAADPLAAVDWSPDGFTALHFAAFLGSGACARELLDARADVSAVSRNAMQVQPLHSAAAAGNVEVATILLEHGADPNAEQQDGFLPLDAARQNPDEAMQALLLEHGARASR
jgi:ankyrin repeat protein